MEDMLAGNNETDLFGSAEQPLTGGAAGETADDIFGDSPQPQQGSQDQTAQIPSGNGSTDILLSAGVLSNTVIDANDTNKYRLNSLGVMLLKHGLQQDVDVEIKDSTHLSDFDWHEM